MFGAWKARANYLSGFHLKNTSYPAPNILHSIAFRTKGGTLKSFKKSTVKVRLSTLRKLYTSIFFSFKSGNIIRSHQVAFCTLRLGYECGDPFNRGRYGSQTQNVIESAETRRVYAQEKLSKMTIINPRTTLDFCSSSQKWWPLNKHKSVPSDTYANYLGE